MSAIQKGEFYIIKVGDIMSPMGRERRRVVMSVLFGVGVGDYLSGKSPATLSLLGAVSSIDLMRGEWWRLLTCCFVHVGVLHLLANMLALGMMGPLAELLWGRWRLLVIYAVSGLVVLIPRRMRLFDHDASVGWRTGRGWAIAPPDCGRREFAGVGGCALGDAYR